MGQSQGLDVTPSLDRALQAYQRLQALNQEALSQLSSRDQLRLDQIFQEKKELAFELDQLSMEGGEQEPGLLLAQVKAIESENALSEALTLLDKSKKLGEQFDIRHQVRREPGKGFDIKL